ncbi:hypothetical protein ACJX0J_030917, partial [Zea mays]
IEANCLGQLRHPKLVELIVYCCEDDHRKVAVFCCCWFLRSITAIHLACSALCAYPFIEALWVSAKELLGIKSDRDEEQPSTMTKGPTPIHQLSRTSCATNLYPSSEWEQMRKDNYKTVNVEESLHKKCFSELRTFLLKPFKLITVFLHETSHALACKLTCGDNLPLDVTTHTSPLPSLFLGCTLFEVVISVCKKLCREGRNEKSH